MLASQRDLYRNLSIFLLCFLKVISKVREKQNVYNLFALENAKTLKKWSKSPNRKNFEDP